MKVYLAGEREHITSPSSPINTIHEYEALAAMTRCRWLLGVRCQLLAGAGGGAAADKISQARRTPQPGCARGGG